MTAGTARALQLPRLFGPEMHEDPYPIYRALRHGPLRLHRGVQAPQTDGDR
jgi:hypothetical protein